MSLTTRFSWSKSMASADPDWQRARAADLSGRPAHGAGIVQLEVREGLEPGFESHPQLHPGQVRPCASMDAEAEGGVAVDLAVDDHLVRPLEGVRVAVGGREREQHELVGL